MATRDIITDLTDLTHPLPEEPDEFADDDAAAGWSAMREQVIADREAFEQGLRLTWEHEDDYDPLLSEIAAARDAMLAAQARMRLLIAYGRDFNRPGPYRLEDLARAAGMSISGIRTAFGNREIAEVARLTGTRPKRHDGRRGNPAAGAALGGQPW